MRIVAISLILLQAFNALAIQDTYIAEMKAKDVEERSKIANLVHIDSVLNDRVYAIVNSDDLKLLNKKRVNIISYQSLASTGIRSYYEPLVGEIDFPDQDQAFHTYDETVQFLRDLATRYPALVQVISIGRSIENRDIWGIRISDDSEANEEKSGIAYMGTHHAREHLSTEIPLMFAAQLLEQGESDVDIQNLFKSTEIFVVPMVNPDGVIHDIQGRNYKWWRKNRRHNRGGTYGVDLNRNYGYGWGTGGSSSNPSSDIYKGEAPFSEPETQSIRDFFLAHRNITVALSVHTFSELILYPWGGKNDGIGGEDELLFKKMAADMAAMNHYSPMQSSELYIASGDTCDWLYGELQVFCFTFELSPSSMFGGGFYPGASIIERVFDANYPPMLYLANLADDPRQVLPPLTPPMLPVP